MGPFSFFGRWGVQAQSLTIDRQMRRYRIPRLAFINKMDRTGSNANKVVEQLRVKLGCDAVLMQLPIGAEHNFEGVVDLLREEAVYFDGDNGEIVRREPVPPAMAEEVKAARQHLLETVSMYSDEMMEILLAEEPLSLDLVDRVIREAVLSQQLTPVILGSAYKNKGVQPLLDAVTRYLPSPLDTPIKALAHDDPHKEVPLTPDPNKPMVGMAFKIVEDAYGTLTFMRIYQGRIRRAKAISTSGMDARSAIAASCGCTPTSGKTLIRPKRAISWPFWGWTPPAATRTARNILCARWRACSCPSQSSRWRWRR